MGTFGLAVKLVDLLSHTFTEFVIPKKKVGLGVHIGTINNRALSKNRYTYAF